MATEVPVADPVKEEALRDFEMTQAERVAWFLQSSRHQDGYYLDRVYNEVRDNDLVKRYKDKTEDWSISIYEDGSVLIEHEIEDGETVTLHENWSEFYHS